MFCAKVAVKNVIFKTGVRVLRVNTIEYNKIQYNKAFHKETIRLFFQHITRPQCPLAFYKTKEDIIRSLMDCYHFRFHTPL